MRGKTLVLFLALFAAWPVQAADKAWLETGVIGGYGVQVKEARTSDGELKQIKEAGLDYVRFVIPWYEVEKGKGSFVWGYFDTFVERLREQGLGAVIVIGAGHPSYTKKIKAPEGNMDGAESYLAAPATPESLAAFANYAAKTVEHFGTDDIIWEIWNEPDSDRFWAPEANAKDYAALAQAACRAIRAVRPEAKIVGPGMADTPGRFGSLVPGFLGKVLLSPAGACLDAVSVHPYRDGAKPPETVLGAYEKLRAYITSFAKKEKPVLATEWGFTLTSVTEEEQADYLLRTFLLNSLSGVPVSIWYEWRDAGKDENDPEAHFGLLDLRRKEKESYRALAAFLPPLKGSKIEERVRVGGADDFVLRLRHPSGKKALVFWTSSSPAKAKLVWRSGAFGAAARQAALSARPQILWLPEGGDVQLSVEEAP